MQRMVGYSSLQIAHVAIVIAMRNTMWVCQGHLSVIICDNFSDDGYVFLYPLPFFLKKRSFLLMAMMFTFPLTHPVNVHILLFPEENTPILPGSPQCLDLSSPHVCDAVKVTKSQGGPQESFVSCPTPRFLLQYLWGGGGAHSASLCIGAPLQRCPSLLFCLLGHLIPLVRVGCGCLLKRAPAGGGSGDSAASTGFSSSPFTAGAPLDQ